MRKRQQSINDVRVWKLWNTY